MSGTKNFVCNPPRSCFECPFPDCKRPNQKMTYDEAAFSRCRKTKESKLCFKEYRVALHACLKQKILL